MPEAATAAASGPRRVAESFGLRLRYTLAAIAFFIGYRVLGLRRGVIRGNLQRSFPAAGDAERRRIRNEFVTRQSEILAELDYSRAITPAELRARVDLVDPHGVLQQAERVIVVAGHQCNFEWLLLRLSLELGPDLVCVYKQMNSARAERYFNGIRTKFGARMLPSTQIRQELRSIRSARMFGLVADQVPRTSPERHWTQFLHQHTAFFMGPERMARLLRARMVYLSMHRVGRGCYEVMLEPLAATGEKLPEGESTERYARALERDIVADPAGWWWSHRRWKQLRDRKRDAA
jgi:KDO2-lipid IV(A) lauroyltransferase